jgi:hypothetical protein
MRVETMKRWLWLAVIFICICLVFAENESSSVVSETPKETVAAEKPVILSPEDEEKAKTSGQKFKFETEVNRMMKLIINSLYKTKGNSFLT